MFKNKLMLLIVASAIPHLAAAGGASEINRLIAQARAATASYHNVETAEKAGYRRASPCEPGMGYHYFNFDAINLTETQPQVLLYEDSPDGLKLVGVEYFVPALTLETGDVTLWFGSEAPTSGFLNPPPVLFAGQIFNGPMAGHSPDMPWHYDLHAYIWKHNPDGTFTTLNPTVNCN